MPTPQELLKNHPLYGLDRAIIDYLDPILERQFPGPFPPYRAREEAQIAGGIEATTRRGARLAGQELELQEHLLEFPPLDPQLVQAWRALMAAAQGEWRELCHFYSVVISELGDLVCMAAAQQAADESGDPGHAARVRGILGLDGTVSPTWWPQK